jgi:hypothetical protein
MPDDVVNRKDDSLDPVHATMRDVQDDAGSGGGTDEGTPVGDDDVDADRARSGADPDGVGAGSLPPLLRRGGQDDDGGSDGTAAVGSADRDADVERSR